MKLRQSEVTVTTRVRDVPVSRQRASNVGVCLEHGYEFTIVSMELQHPKARVNSGVCLVRWYMGGYGTHW